jgi:hypothetical protein
VEEVEEDVMVDEDCEFVFRFGVVEEVVFRRLSSLFGVIPPFDTVGVAAFALFDLLRLLDFWT